MHVLYILHSCKIYYNRESIYIFTQLQDNPFLFGAVSFVVRGGVLGWYFQFLGILGQGQPQLRVRNMLGQDVA